MKMTICKTLENSVMRLESYISSSREIEARTLRMGVWWKTQLAMVLFRMFSRFFGRHPAGFVLMYWKYSINNESYEGCVDTLD